MTARSASSLLANARARSTPPASGETTVRFGIFSSFQVFNQDGQSHIDDRPGYQKIPESDLHADPWKESDRVPAAVSRSATSFDEIGTRGLSFRSCLAYP